LCLIVLPFFCDALPPQLCRPLPRSPSKILASSPPPPPHPPLRPSPLNLRPKSRSPTWPLSPLRRPPPPHHSACPPSVQVSHLFLRLRVGFLPPLHPRILGSQASRLWAVFPRSLDHPLKPLILRSQLVLASLHLQHSPGVAP